MQASTRLLLSFAISTALAAAGCGADSAGADGALADAAVGPSPDGAARDLAGMPRTDLAGSPTDLSLAVADLSLPVADLSLAVADQSLAVADLSLADLSRADLAVSDLAVSDLAVADLALVSDLSHADLAAAPDLAVLRDLSSLSDLAPLPDLASPPDLGGAQACNGTSGFGPAFSDFALPTGFDKGGFGDLSSDYSCDSFNKINQPRYSVFDIDGDGLPDLVLTIACDPNTYNRDPSVGLSRWIVYKNTGTGFGAPADFAIPTGFNKGGFGALSSDYSCDSFNQINQPRYSLLDVDGDARPDLLLTIACDPNTYNRDTTVGQSRWIVYRNTGTGFAAQPSDFTLPTGFNKGGFGALSSDYSCDSFNKINQPRYSVFDIDGDARPDLVLTIACDPNTYNRDTTVGQSRWIVYPNGNAGFGAPKDFALPTGFNKGGFGALSSDYSCDSFNQINQPRYRVLDLDGDHKPDLVLLIACDPNTYNRDTTVGTSRWIVYSNHGNGFGAPADFSLPTGFNKGGFSNLSSDYSCDSFNAINQPRYTITDLDGDGKPDLVLTIACDANTYNRDPSVGVSRWIYYRSSGAGFPQNGADFCLPTGFPKGGFSNLSSDYSCDSFNKINQPRYRVLDVAGDRRLDLLLTIACDANTYNRDPSVGVSRWRLALGK